MTEAFNVALTGVASNGNVTQIYPPCCTAGVAKSGSTAGQLLRRPLQGVNHSFQLRSDGVNAGTLELWDIDGEDWGADVSSGTTITNAQLVAAVAAGQAKLLFRGDYAAGVGSGILNAAGIYRPFAKGLAARLVSTGTGELNLVNDGGFWKTESKGGY